MKKKTAITRKCDIFFKKMNDLGLGLSYGDVLLKPYHSKVLPKDVNLRTRFSRNVPLRIPVVSAPMDTVTESKMAIEMALEGGIGIIHKGLPPKNQALEVSRVKHYLHGFIPDPICVSANDTVEKVLEMKKEKNYKFFSFPVLDKSKKLVGLITRNDFGFCLDEKKKISEIMSKTIISAEEGITIEAACQKMQACHKKILPILDSAGNLKGIYTFADVRRTILGNPDDYNLDAHGSLLVGAAVGVGDYEERMELLSQRKVDVVVVDSAHGDSDRIIKIIKYCKKNYPHIDAVAGNITEAAAAKRLAAAGADGLRVGIGPGSICTTRIISGVGCPQVTAVYNCSRAVRGSDIPVCADGGIKYSGDIAIALAAGAGSVMIGNLFAGTEESPGEVIYKKNGKPVKVYRGMGSLEAMQDNQASRERYGQSDSEKDKLVPEGVKGEVDYKGEIAPIIFQLIGGVRSSFGYLGAKNISLLQQRADFYRISSAGLKESHPSLEDFENAPNYSV